MDNIVVSICCIAYNAEKYIAQTLDSFLMQKCSFDYEILIHDDASTDNTAAIIREYEEKYPSIIHGVYQTENQYSKGVRISITYLYPKAKGKYIALCEGDDFWTDSNKLQMQVDALENNPCCHMCVHKVKGIYDDLTPVGKYYPNFHLNSGIISSRDFVNYNCTNDYIFQTSSYFMLAKDIMDYKDNYPKFARVSATGDLAHMLYFATKGDIYYIADEMSCYRQGSTSSKCRIEKYTNTEQKIQKHFNKQIEMMREYDIYTDGEYHKFCERKINGYLFDKAMRNNEFREVIRLKYRFYFRKYSFKFRIKSYLYVLFPRLISVYNKGKVN